MGNMEGERRIESGVGKSREIWRKKIKNERNQNRIKLVRFA